MKSLALRSVLSVAALGAALSSHAQVANGGFEVGASENSASISGWGTVGNAFLSSTARFSTPAQGAYQATVATALDGQFGERPGIGVSATAAESQLGLSQGALSAVGNGRASRVSAVTQTVHLNAGDRLLLGYDFLTDEVYKATDPNLSTFDLAPNASRNDFGFFSYSVGGASGIVKLIDTFYGYSRFGPGQSDFTTGLFPTPDSDPLFSESGYLSYAFTASVSGDYLIGLGVADGETGQFGTSGLPSGMLFDDVRIETVPEPASMLALGLGAAAMLRRGRK